MKEKEITMVFSHAQEDKPRAFSLKYVFVSKGQASVGSVRLRPTSGACTASQLETGGHTSWQGFKTPGHGSPETT